MARRRRSRSSRLNKGWAYNEGTIILSGADADATIANGDVLQFTDISSDFLLIQKERSEYAIRRAIIWCSAGASGGGAFIATSEFDMRVRLGMVDTAGFVQEFDTGGITSPEYAANVWGRIFWERSFLLHRSAPLVREPDALVTSAGPGTFAAYPVPPIQWEIDVKPNARITEGSQFALMVGTQFPDDDITYSLSWQAKVLLTKVE